jgi:putative transcriptional regulator
MVRASLLYAGWSAGQLEGEMEGGSWLVAPATIERVFSTQETLWRQIRREIELAAIMAKADPKILPVDPSLN